MQVKDILKMNGEILAYCVGEDIPSDFTCKKVIIEGKEFNVLKSGSSRSFCGRMNALMTLDVKEASDIPLGEFIITA